MRKEMSKARRVQITSVAAALLAVAADGAAQAPRGGNTAPPTPRAAAPNDLTGHWVSIVTEDWRWRMMTPPPKDYASLPITPAARAVADAWNPAADLAAGNECRPYGAGGIMRVPGRIHITWEDDDTLRVDTDAGTQTRLFQFSAFTPAREPTWQGNSVASWQMVGGTRGRPSTGGSLKVVTTGMKSGYVRWNGVPYSEDAVITEHYDRHAAFDQEWITITTIIEDPQYFSGPFITSSDFRKEPDGSKWNPTPCVTDAPAVEATPTTGD
jgi:hypothetical protein